MSNISIDSLIRVKGCPYCELLERKENIVYQPRKNLEDCSFVIVICPKEKREVVIATEHLPSLARGLDKLALFHARKYKQSNVSLRVDRRYVSDHWHAYIELI